MIWYVATLIASVFSTRGTAAQGAHGVREEPRFVTARAGESVILGCDVSPPLDGQQPPYVVEWFKFGVPIPLFINFRFYPPHVDPEYTGRASLHGKASLQIVPVHPEDQGWYECRVLMLEQQYDTFHNGSWVHLTVNAPPTFTATPPQYVEAKEGGSTLLSCSAQGNPKPMISWLREGEELATNAKYTVHDGSLTILGITREDRGAYTCRAYSDQGEVLHTTRLLVQGPPYIVTPPENITVNISQNALFTCQAEAYPGNLTYTWFWEEDNVYFKNDLKLRVRILIDGTLIIFRVKPEDAGKYTCSPSNSLGVSPSASAHLTVHVLAQNKLGTGPFSEVVTVNTAVSPMSTPEPQVLLTPPRCLTANRTQHGVLLTWLPPANHSSPVDRYIMEFRLGERWEVLDDLIPATETELIARDLVQESWYEFKVMAVMDDLISESSNVVGVSSTDPFPPAEVADEGLARPVVAGVVATICFLAAAVLFSTLAACFVNKQHRRKLKRKPDPPLSVTHFRKSIESPPPLTPLPGVEPCWDEPARSSYMPPPASPLLSSGKISPESSPPSRPRSLSSDEAHGPGLYVRRLSSPQRDRGQELSFYKKTKRAITSKKYSVSKHEAEVTTPIELISRGPDGRFVMEISPPPRRIQGFPFAEESDMYPEFRQSDEENDFDPGPLPPIMPTLRPQLSPTSSSLESTQPPTYSPRLHRAMEGMSFVEGSGLHASGQAPTSRYRGFPQGPFYGYLGSRGESGIPPPFYMPDMSPRSSALSSPPGTGEGPFGYPSIPEESGEMEHHQYTASGHSLPHSHSPPPRSPESWQPHEFPFLGLEGTRFIYPPHHPLHHQQDLPDPPPYPPHFLPPSRLHLPPLKDLISPRLLQLEVPMAPPGRERPLGPPARRLAMQQAQSLGQLRHTTHGMGVPVLPYPDPAVRAGSPSTAPSSSPQSWLSPRARRRADPGLPPLVLQPSRLSPLSQSPLSTQPGSPDILVRPPPHPSILRTSRSLEMPEIALHPSATASFSRRSSLAISPTHGQGSRRPSPSYHPHMSYASTAASYPSQSPSPPLEGRDVFGQRPSQRRTEEEMLPSEPSQLQISASGEPLGASSDAAGSESLQALLQQCITKAKRVAANTNNNSTSKRRTGASPSQTRQPSQTAPAGEDLYLHRKRKRQSKRNPYVYLTCLLRRRRPDDDQMGILASTDSEGHNYGSLH
ncbi:protein turtle homolog B-like [Hypomesus transpacificus]|uniref:protein turtle homolog B-like n=1 Tax=Hypomesus transpacificus TaxID=137520 RepID=UPI001F081A2F|nr:protein turtle homolog B-like [Hypomesus transpacificus]